MKSRCPSLVLIFAAAIVTTLSSAQDAPEDWESLPELMQDIQYAQVLAAARLDRKQLAYLAGFQTAWQEAKTSIRPDVLDAVRSVRNWVLLGTPTDEAFAKLGEFQREVHQAQGGLGLKRRELAKDFRAQLTPEQIGDLAWFQSPGRALQDVIRGVARSRRAPEQPWRQFTEQAVNALANIARQAGTGKIPRDRLLELLKTARTLKDDAFKDGAPELTRQWAEVLMPKLLEQMGDEKFRAEAALRVCDHLITYPRSEMLLAQLHKAGSEKPAAEK